MRRVILLAFLVSLTSVLADVRQARKFLRENQPDKAEESLRQNVKSNPDDPWLAYNSAVIAYASKNFEKADKIWQDLAARPLPPKLRDQVWIQIGNVSYRRGELFEKSTPEESISFWEQSREAYRLAQASRPKDVTVVHNLRVVESRLAKLHAQWGERFYDESLKLPERQAVEKLQTARDHQIAARDLEPKNESYQAALAKTEHQLSVKFTDKGIREEKKADSTVAAARPSDWEMQQAEENLKTALTDFQEANKLDSHNLEAQEGEQRTQEKLANLLAKQGRQHQRYAQAEEYSESDRAMNEYEEALQKFQEALSAKPEHADAKAGEREVKAAMEKLHIKEGDRLAKEGRQQIPRRPEQAADKMLSALGHYQQAQTLNPENPETPPKISQLQQELPDLLVGLGQNEQMRASNAEPKSPDRAVAHLEKAATSFEKAQDIDEAYG